MSDAPIGSSQTCLACGSSNLRTKDYPCRPANLEKQTLRFTTIEFCETCGMGVAAPRVPQSQIDQFYAAGDYWSGETINPYLDLHYRAQSRARLRKVLEHFKTSGRRFRVLDIGAGRAALALYLADFFPGTEIEYDFIEPDDALAEAALSRPTSIKVTRVASLEAALAGRPYDLVFANHVLEHVSEPEVFLRQVFSASAVGGLVYIEVPHRDDEIKADVFPHTLFFSPEALSQLTTRDGRVAPLEVKSFGSIDLAGRATGWRRLRLAALSRLSRLMLDFGFPRLALRLNEYMTDYSASPRGLWLQGIFQRISV